ncbi:hypothetical protein CEUSTIGMA_g1822.t1 [Chlamydomonas eustigma]|uniref:Uncharacterized protein n=1 Tax=Chlamydomonas eustigma TaxID=1157962 RepID=A0A250WU75_9CHLO|nr:hypothetical protein CEUSTIGMA_g1822.t1 [Chlamydomonas eustigma]|eukprot:GAX74374.1 hypothetical protein CEUSTIGMA_g1822.t1 [Chlamydomonas eustigma]
MDDDREVSVSNDSHMSVQLLPMIDRVRRTHSFLGSAEDVEHVPLQNEFSPPDDLLDDRISRPTIFDHRRQALRPQSDDTTGDGEDPLEDDEVRNDIFISRRAILNAEQVRKQAAESAYYSTLVSRASRVSRADFVILGGYHYNAFPQDNQHQADDEPLGYQLQRSHISQQHILPPLPSPPAPEPPDVPDDDLNDAADDNVLLIMWQQANTTNTLNTTATHCNTAHHHPQSARPDAPAGVIGIDDVQQSASTASSTADDPPEVAAAPAGVIGIDDVQQSASTASSTADDPPEVAAAPAGVGIDDVQQTASTASSTADDPPEVAAAPAGVGIDDVQQTASPADDPEAAALLARPPALPPAYYRPPRPSAYYPHTTLSSPPVSSTTIHDEPLQQY